MNTKLTILYERLSREDERETESISIENQKAFLEDYATQNGFTNLLHLTDDGWSGTRWDRPSYLRLIEEVERGNVANCIVKDMSRIGRDHLRVGLLLEQFRESGVRFIAVNDNVDTDKGMDDFTPFRNIINEWVARDTSRKIRTIFNARTAQGKHVTGALPYGYLHDPNDRQNWLLDEVAAPIVKRIYKSIIEGKTIAKIAEELTKEKVLCPNAHWQNINEATSKGRPSADPYKWSSATIVTITAKQEYMGWKVLNKTTKENYKAKRKPTPKEDLIIFKDMHPVIIDEEMWNVVQRLRETKRSTSKLDGKPNPLTGVLYCADCGQKMYHKKGSTGRENQPYHEYVCSSYRHYSRTCTCHYIRVPVVEDLILRTIQQVSKYVNENEEEFIAKVHENAVIIGEETIKANRKKITTSKRRREEISGLVKKLYETYATGKISEEHFTELINAYSNEQQNIDAETELLNAEIKKFNTESVKADKFIDLVKRHTELAEFTPLLLNEFIEKVVVYEPVKENGKRNQRVDIYLNFIGQFTHPITEELPQEQPKKGSRGRKLRHEMTEEEIQKERERDRERYARKVADKKAKEQAERLAILQGTKYEIKISEEQINKGA